MRKVLLIVISLLGFSGLSAQWRQPLHDFYIGTSVIQRDNDLMASTWYGGFFVSENNGQSWTNYQSQPNLQYISKMTRIGQNIVASVYPDAIYTSTNDGITWFASQVNMSSEVKSFTVSGLSVYAGLRNGTVLKSTDLGITWYNLNLKLTNLTCLTLYREYLIIGTKSRFYFIDTVNYIPDYKYKSDIARITDIAVEDSVILIGTEDEGIYISTDEAKTWKLAVKGLEEYSIIDLEIKNGVFYAVNFNGVYKSPNKGKDWFCITLDYPILDVQSIQFIGNKLFIFSDENGMLVSIDGNKPVLSSSGLKFRSINTLYNFDIYTLSGIGTGIYKSTDRGTSWNSVTKFNLNKEITGIVANKGKIFAAAGWSGVIMSADSSKTWLQSFDNPDNVFVTSVVESVGKVFTGTVREGVFRCIDNDTSWQQANTGMSNTEVLCLAARGADIYAGTDGGGVFVSYNGGDFWEELSPVLKFQKINSIDASGDTIAVVVGSGIVMISTDKGKSWKEDFDVLSGNINTIKIYDNKIIAGTTEGVLIYNDFYDKWQPQNNGLSYKNVRCLDFHGSMAFAGTDSGGVYMAALQDLKLGINDKQKITTDILLFPQPASDYIYIDLPDSFNNPEITLTNELGIIIKRSIYTGGRINIESLVPGLYFCTVNSGSNFYKGKFIVNK